MNTTRDKEFDYQSYYREHPLNRTEISGTEEREERRKVAKARAIVPIDEAIVEQFKQMSGTDGEHRDLIHQALREWLSERKKHE